MKKLFYYTRKKALALTVYFILASMALHAQIITTCIGNGTYGYTGDGGPATDATLSQPSKVAVDRGGNVYVIVNNDVVRKVNTAGIITTIAGNGTSGDSGDGGPATAAQLDYPSGIAIDTAGNIYIANGGSDVVRKINTAGIITTVAGNHTGGYSGDHGPATAAQLHGPSDVAVDMSGNIYIVDYGNNVVRKVNTSGIITTIAGNGYGAGMGTVGGFTGDNGPATDAELFWPLAIAIDKTDNIYIADVMNHRIRKVNTSGIITTIAGNGAIGYSGDSGPATAAKLSSDIYGVAVDQNNNVYISDGNNNVIRRVNSTGIITTYAGNGTAGYNGDNLLAVAAGLNYPEGVAISDSGILYIADLENNRIRKVTYWPESVSPVAADRGSVQIWPNPVGWQLTIAGTEKITSVTIMNLVGQCVYAHEYNAEKVEVNVAELPKGIYLIKINGAIVKRFVKE